MQRTHLHEGMTLVELLVALAVSALLLVAVAGAFNASVINYTENDRIHRSAHKARQALARLTTQVRTATYVDPSCASDRCTLTTADGQELTYLYRQDQQALYLVCSDGSEYLLCGEISSMTFSKTPTASGNNTILVRTSITVGTANNQQHFCSSTVIRKNL